MWSCSVQPSRWYISCVTASAAGAEKARSYSPPASGHAVHSRQAGHRPEPVTEAFKWLADRGFGQAPKTVQIEGSVTTGFKMVFRRWAPGTDPASLPMAEMPKQIVTSARVLDIKPTNGTNGKNGKP